ncbi:hypothetical protein MACJ_003213 [Theileria orientalis]|uniref:Uncharacterized protein n=1 Tax=Theileria orientalis TaxID=68886 RepID=A0A976QR34_THEOR|nr:hypothetical protein MACJ_003213 [Theileria orientalis]
MQFKTEIDEIFINTPLVAEGNLRGINSRNTEHYKKNENKPDEKENKRTVGSYEAETKFFSGKSLDHGHLVTRPAVTKSYVYKPHDQYLEIGFIKGRRNGGASRSRIRNKWAGTVLDPLSPYTVGDGKFLQFQTNVDHLNKRVLNTYRNNFLQYNLTGDAMTKKGINGSFNAYRAEDTISKNESMKLTIYISVFAGTFGVTVLVFWLFKILSSSVSKRKSSNLSRSGDRADAKSMSDYLEDDLCLAESRSNNPSLLKIDHYITAGNDSGSALSDLDESDEDYDEDDVDSAINRLRSIFDIGVEDDEEGYDEETPLLQEEHQNNENSATAVINGNTNESSTLTNDGTSVDPTPTVNLSYEKNVFI